MKNRQVERNRPTSERLEWYREMERLSKEIDGPTVVQFRGRIWDVLPTGLTRTVGQNQVAIPMGDLTDFEVAECLKAMRIQAIADLRKPRFTAAEIAADHDFWEAQFDAAPTREQLAALERCRKSLKKGVNPVQALLGFLKPPMETP